MAEPAGLLIEAEMTKAELASFFKRSIMEEGHKVRVGHVLSRWLDRGDLHGDVVIVHHDPARNNLFLAWLLNHYSAEAMAPVWPLLDILGKCTGTSATATGVIASTLPEYFETVRIANGKVVREAYIPIADGLVERFWSFASKGQFPDAATSMRRRDYQCKPFRHAWKTYLTWRNEEERPARIAAATAQNPHNLFGNIYCWDHLVVDRDSYTGRDIVLPEADPLTLRMENGYFADKSHVWQRRLAKNSPSSDVQRGTIRINNPAAIWEYQIVPDADGAQFTWLYDRWDTVFWTDASRIYSTGPDGLVPLHDVDAGDFRSYGQCFGTDGQSVFWFANKLTLDAQKLRTDGFFVWDDKKVFYCATELPLRGSGFRILGRASVRGTGFYRYRLTDGDMTIILQPDRAVTPDEPESF
ncbi:MAG TPA: hypothetical protein VGM83_06665 [Devosiaceae bacterium]|jgi:hypothetical protein